MSKDFEYKATFTNPKNNYLKYFCEKPASEWTYKKFKNHFEQLKKDHKSLYEKQLRTIKEHSKGIPPAVLQEINNQLALNAPNMSSPSIKKVENYYNINTVQGDFIINTVADRTEVRSKKKQKVKSDEESEESFPTRWNAFLTDAENNKNLHKYSPEKNGVLRLTNKIEAQPSLGDTNQGLKSFINDLLNNASADLEESIEDVPILKDYKADCQFIKKICSIMVNVNDKSPSMTYSESVFNFSLMHPCLLATTVYLSKACACGSYFTPGEEPLNAMNEQLINLKSKVDHRKAYNADGVIRFSSLLDLEVLLLETSGSFKNKDERKISFDNIKGLYALLSMIKTVADKFGFASADLFKNLKLYFVQASGEYIRLWSIQYASNGVYIFNREHKITVTEERANVEEMLNSLINFFSFVKASLEETFNVLQQLRDENEEIKRLNEGSNSQQVLLSDVICPKIFRLSYNTHGKGFGTQNYNESPEND